MEDEAEKAGLNTEQEVVDLVKSLRKELWEKNGKTLSIAKVILIRQSFDIQ